MIDGTIEHFMMGIVSTFISLKLHGSIWPSVWIAIGVELAQNEMFQHIQWLDSIHDLGMHTTGLLLVKIAF